MSAYLCDAAFGKPFEGLLSHCLFFLLACLSYLHAGALYHRPFSDGRSPSALIRIRSPQAGCCRRRHHPALHRTLFDKRSFFLAFTAIELSVFLGYGRQEYTANWTDVINTKFGGAAADPLADNVPRGAVFPRTFSLPRGIATVSVRSLVALGFFHRLVGVVPRAPRL